MIDWDLYLRTAGSPTMSLKEYVRIVSNLKCGTWLGYEPPKAKKQYSRVIKYR